MQQTKLIVKGIYTLLRFIFTPVILLFRPIGRRTESIVSMCTVWVAALLILSIASDRVSVALKVTAAAICLVLAYLFRLWGKEFESY
jgi:hypothetical protein